MGNLTLLIALGIFGFMLLFMFFKLRSDGGESEHFFLQLLVLGFLLGVFVLIGKVGLDDKDFCSWNVANATISGDTTVYVYDYECDTNVRTTSTNFYDLITWLIRCVVVYVVLFFFYDLARRLGFIGGKKRGEAD
jgi:hypothetical protein